MADIADGCAFHSRFVRGSARRFSGDLGAVERWLDGLAAKAGHRPLLVPTNDVFIEFILQRANRLAEKFVFPDGYRGLAARLLDKMSFNALCLEHGVATPGVWQAPDRDALAALAPSLPFPCILKPALIHRAREFLRGRKVLLVRNRAEYEACLATMPDGLGKWFVQEIIPGPESNITLFAGYIDKCGTAQQTFTARKLRQYPPGFGSASLVTSERCEETEATTLRFLDRIGFHGICGAEYKRDPRDGQLKIIEINPRPTLWFQIAHDAGRRVVEAAAHDLGQGEAPVERPQEPSVCWRYSIKDLAAARFYRRKGDSFVFPAPDVSTAARPARCSWPVFAKDDLMPALFEPVGYVRKAWKRL
ncbi:MAG: hypothetical protein M9902_03320 [Thermomonas sp.]|nr:hypothetical protein [Thermomonas sp.]